jgi:hypothetical protein
VCILAVNADRAFWGGALVAGKFASPPAVRLIGTVGELRKATAEELAEWQKRTGLANGTKGYALLKWGEMYDVRDVHFDSLEPIEMGGDMTWGLW